MEFLKNFDMIFTPRIIAFEEKNNFKLPDDYFRFLKNYNGGYPTRDKFNISDSQGIDILDVFHGLDVKPRFSNLDYLVDNYTDRFIHHIIPIGHDAGGNYVCLNVNQGNDYGKVYFYDHEVENEDENGNLTWDNLYLIADSFSDFLEKLY